MLSPVTSAGSFAMDAAALARIHVRPGRRSLLQPFCSRKTSTAFAGSVTSLAQATSPASAGMGVDRLRPTQRCGEGVTARLVEARERGDRMMVLEVIEQNPAACCLYRSENFRELTRLFGWRRAAGVSLPDPPAQVAPILEEIAPLTASQLPSSLEFPELPWQVSRHAVAKLARGRAYSSRGNVIVIDDPGGTGPMRISALSSCTLNQWIGRHYAQLSSPSFAVIPTASFSLPPFSRKSSAMKSSRRSASSANRSVSS